MCAKFILPDSTVDNGIHCMKCTVPITVVSEMTVSVLCLSQRLDSLVHWIEC